MRLFIAVLLIGMGGSLLTNMSPVPSTSSTSHELVVNQTEPPSEEAPDTPATMMNMDGAIQLERKADGHFYADVTINGTPETMLIDTGAIGNA
jgi:predicted aspartyl protease